MGGASEQCLHRQLILPAVHVKQHKRAIAVLEKDIIKKSKEKMLSSSTL
jgi:hypothetical protein